MTETHPETKPQGPFFVSCNQGNSSPASGWRGQLCEEEATYVILTATPRVPDPCPGTLRPDFYSSETDGDRDREISNGLPHAALCAHREIGDRVRIRSLWSPIDSRAGGLSAHNRTLRWFRNVTSV